MRSRMVTHLAVLLAAFMLIPAIAWAVVGNLNVKVTNENTGDPVAGVTITVGDQTKVTGQDGTVTFTVEEGLRLVNIKSENYHPSTRSIEVPAGGTKDVTVELLPHYPWEGQIPGTWAIGFGGAGTYPGRQQFVVESFIDKLNIPGMKTQTFVQGSQVLPTLGAQKGYALDLPGGNVPFVFGAPGVHLPGGFRLFPAAQVALGGGDAKVHVQSTMVPFLDGSNYDLSGAVFTWDASGHLLLQSPWANFGYPYVAAGGGYGSIGETHLNRSDGAPGTYDFGWSKWYWDATAGVSLFNRQVAPFVGIQQTWYSSSVNSHMPIPWSMSSFAGSTVDREIGLKANRTEGLVGLNVRFPTSFPIYANAQAGISPHAISATLRFSLMFDLH